MHDRLTQFSCFVRELNAHSQELDVEAIVSWSVQELSEILGFDASWYGWAEFVENDVTIHASKTLNLPEGYYDTWQEIADEDLLAADIWANPSHAASYDRLGQFHTSGMVALSDTYGLRQMATAMCIQPSRQASLYVSAYRGPRTARAWSSDDLEFLKCAVDQISECGRRVVAERVRQDPRVTTVIVNGQGVGILGMQRLRARLGNIWPELNNAQLPEIVQKLLSEPGDLQLPDHGIVVTCRDLQESKRMDLRELVVRPINKMDYLSVREHKVAQLLVAGKTHKEAASILGVSPSTVRNQTQSIYEKLEINNRASLAVSLLNDGGHKQY